MSYEIIRWETKEIEGLKLPLSAFQELDLPSQGWTYLLPFKITGVDSGKLEIAPGFKDGMDFEIDHDKLEMHIIDLYYYGEGSGRFYRKILVPVLEKSVGTLCIIVVWEDGRVFRLRANNGEVIEEEMEL